jgi:translation initiation factor IF-3
LKDDTVVRRKHRINDEITSRSVRVIGPEGEKIGVLSIREALYMASDEGLDLVEVAPVAKPPVCKILDYGKLRYEMGKKQKKSHGQKTIVKTIKIKHNIEDFDLERKISEIQKFVDKNFKVAVQMMLRGRARDFTENAKVIMERVKVSVENAVCSFPKDRSGNDVNGRGGSFKLDFTPNKAPIK